jgi:hypothetical protein
VDRIALPEFRLQQVRVGERHHPVGLDRQHGQHGALAQVPER